jgi:hypothetical protein
VASYRLLLRVVVGTALALTLGPTLVRAAGHRSKGELFPLSRWAMFNRVDSQVDDYGIRLRTLAGKPVSPPVYFENAGFTMSQLVTAYIAIQKFAERTVKQDADVDTARTLVEQQYLGGPGVEYDLVARRWDPLVRWKGGPFESERLIASFVSGSTAIKSTASGSVVSKSTASGANQ